MFSNPATTEDVEKMAARRKRRQGVEKALLQGHTSERELAVRYGVQGRIIRQDIEYILYTWKHTSETTWDEKLKRIRQLETVMQNAWESYEMSRLSEPDKDGNRTRMRAGSSSFLGIIGNCLVEINRLEGNYAPKRIEKTASVLHAHTVIDYSTADTETLINAKIALEKLKESAIEKSRSVSGMLEYTPLGAENS